MDNWSNILDENVLKTNVNFVALFVLNFECLKDYIVSQVRDFYNDIYIENGELICKESEEYKKKVRILDRQIDNASLKWFIEAGAVSEEDYEMYQKIRVRRNDMTHEFLKNLNNGFGGEDVVLFSSLLELYQKIDKWWINEIEVPTSAEEIPENYDKDGVCGGQAMLLSIINDIVLGNGGEKYKELLGEILKLTNVQEG